MIKKIAMCVASFGIMFSFTACGGISEGEVYDKSYEPYREWTEQIADYQWGCQYEYGINPANGKFEYTNVCKERYVGQKTVTRHEDECYRVYFRNADGDKGDACVGAERYEEIELGDWFKA